LDSYESVTKKGPLPRFFSAEKRLLKIGTHEEFIRCSLVGDRCRGAESMGDGWSSLAHCVGAPELGLFIEEGDGVRRVGLGTLKKTQQKCFGSGKISCGEEATEAILEMVYESVGHRSVGVK